MHKLRFTTQVGHGMKQMLVSVMNTVRVGNMVVFGANRNAMRALANAEKLENNMIVNVKTGRQSKIHEKRGAYVYHKKKEENGSECNGGGIREQEQVRCNSRFLA